MTRSAHLSLALFCALLAGIAAAVLALPAPAPADEERPAPEPVSGQATTILEDGSQAVAGEVLVGYSEGSAPQTVPIPESADPAAVAARIEQTHDVSYAIPNYVASASGWLPNDDGVNPGRRGPRGGWRAKQWNFLPCLSLCHSSLPSNRPQSRGGINVIRAWQNMRRAGRAGASGVKVAVIDSGIAYRNLGRQFRRNPELGANRFLPGRDFVDNDRLPLDLYGHGTHVALTVGEQTNNKRGLTGIAYRSKLMPVRVLDENGDGSTDDIVAVIEVPSVSARHPIGSEHVGARRASLRGRLALIAPIAPLLEEERCVRTNTRVSKIPEPVRVHRPRVCAALPACNHPIDPI